MGKYSKCVVSIFLLLLCLGIISLQAYWVDEGVPISTTLENQWFPQITSDGAGGAVITWDDERSGNSDIYAQCIDTEGNVQWEADGVAICMSTGEQGFPQIISDGAGGAVISWQDSSSGNYDIYAQRIDAGGNVQWTTNGVAICTATGEQVYPQIISDGAEGAVITWGDYRSGNWDIYTQRIDADGSVQWTTDGVAICTATGDQGDNQIIFDGTGGALITWGDERSGNSDIYAQRIDAGGNVQWMTDGAAICTLTGGQYNPQITSDGAGGAVITWQDVRSENNSDIYAQRIDEQGNVQWTADGVAICTSYYSQYTPQITSDGAGGAVITWQDARSLSSGIYAQRIVAGGDVQWTTNGVAVCTATGSQDNPQIISDCAGGAAIIWRDYRSGNWDIYAQRIDTEGNVQWIADGVAICTAIGNQEYPRITSDDAGGAVITWHDVRSETYDIYAQKIEGNGRLGFYPAPAITAVQDIPKDQGGRMLLQWERSSVDGMPFAEISHYSVWRRVAKAEISSFTGETREAWPLDVAMDFDGPSIRFCASIEDSAWEWLANVPTHHFENYALTVQSLYDSMGSDPGWQYFMVSAHTYDPVIYFDSPIDSGYSVDNLAPASPMGLAGEQVYAPEGLTLTWDSNTEIDLSGYAVYRGLDEVFVPGPGNIIASPCEITFFDDEWRWDSGYYYKVSASDIHGNESSFALLRPEDVTGEDIPETPLANFLSQNFPNPFNPQTKIAFGIREDSDISLRIYDASGRLVGVLIEERRKAGRYAEAWDGTDINNNAVASGVYFYRLDAGAFTETRKMVLLR